MTRGDDKFKPFPLLYILVIVMIVIAGIEVAFGQGECNGHSCNKDGSPVDVSLTGGDSSLSVGGNDYLGLGIGGSTVMPAIGDCIFTEYDSYFIFWDKQRGKENKHCLAMQEHLIGNHNTEARIKCRDTSIGGLYDTFDQCVNSQQEHTRGPKEGSSGPLDAVAEEIEQHEVVAQQQYEASQIQMTALMEQITDLQEQPKVVYRKAKEPTPFLTDAKRAALLAVKEE